MRFKDFLNEDMFDHSSNIHHNLMRDIDNFTASPRLTLKPETVAYLKSKANYKDMTLYRVLFIDDLEQLAKSLDMASVEVGAKGVHHAKRISSWSYSKSLVEELAVENFDIGNYSVILKAIVPGKSIILNTDDLSKKDREHIYLEVQKEVMVDEGSYPVIVLDVIDNED